MADNIEDKPGKQQRPASVSADKDAIDKLPLTGIPLESTALRNAKLIKNSRMETAVELHSDPLSGSLQIKPEDIGTSFAGSARDQKIIRELATLQSYDVYSLRASLKKLGIKVDDDMLELSATMKDKLEVYATEFTRPLIEKIFGTSGDEIDEKGGLMRLMRDPDLNRVRANLKKMTEQTGIPLEEIPAFLSSYNDTYLSVAYYRHSLKMITPDIERFLQWITSLQEHREISSKASTLQSCRRAEEKLRILDFSINQRMESFYKSFEIFWLDVNRTSYEELRKQIEDNHSDMGAVLCGLIVKIRNWAQSFPDNIVGGPTKRAAFVMTEVEPGLDRLLVQEATARARLGLPPL